MTSSNNLANKVLIKLLESLSKPRKSSLNQQVNTLKLSVISTEYVKKLLIEVVVADGVERD